MGTPLIWHTAKNTSMVTAMATIKASRLVGTLSQVSFLTTCTMILVITIRISTASRMAERTAGMFCRMGSMFMSS